MFSPLEQFDLIMLKQIIYTKHGLLLDLSIFHMILILFFIWYFMKRLLRTLKKKSRLIPSSWQYTQELIYEAIQNIIKQQAGVRGYKYISLVYCIFMTILLCNLFSLMPFSFALTSQIINIFFLSFTLIIGLFITGLINFGFNFFKIFIPESPILLLLILIPIEIFSYIIRAFSIAIRLSANIMAGHTLVVIVSSFLLQLSVIFLSILSILLFIIFTLELGVAVLQAYVFTVLFVIYLKDSLWEAEH